MNEYAILNVYTTSSRLELLHLSKKNARIHTRCARVGFDVFLENNCVCWSFGASGELIFVK